MEDNMRKLLEQFKKELKGNHIGNEVDTMAAIEEQNPNLTKDSRRYKQSKKIIFKQNISNENAEAIINTIKEIQHYSVGNLQSYKSEVRSKAERVFIDGQNPIEMLVYGIKGIYKNELFINAIRDVMKDLYMDHMDKVIEAYKNILTNWNWNDCLNFVLKSISELRINEITSEVYYVLENNNILRAEAFSTLVYINATEYYDSMINLLCNNNNETNAEMEIIGKSLRNFAKSDDDNTYYLYQAYINLSVPNAIKNILVGTIRINLTKRILDDIENKLKDNQILRYQSNKIIDLLTKCKQKNVRGEYIKNQKVIEILERALNYNHLDIGRVETALGEDAEEIQNKIIYDNRRTTRDRANSIISMASKLRDTDLNQLANESDVMKAIVSSVKVQLGNITELIPLFQFIVQKPEHDYAAVEATNQVKRLRGIKDEKLNNQLMKVAEGLLKDDSDSNTENTMKILDLFSAGIQSDEVGILYLNKLNSTKQYKIKRKILEYYKKQYNRYSIELRNKIRDSVILCTREEAISDIAMDCLKSINAYVDNTPGVNKIEKDI